MSEITMDEISIQIEGSSDKAIESLDRLSETLDKITKSTGFSMTALQQTNKKIQNIANTANKSGNKTNKAFDNMGKSVLGFVTKLTGVKFGFLDTTNKAAEFISTYAGFTKVLGTSKKNLDDAKDFVKKLTNAWYLDEQQVMSSMSRYYNMTKTMGFTEDASLRMSKNLTQLSYDLQALGTTGATVTEVQNQLSSALRGEAEGLAKFGISLNQATLQSILYEKGINRTVSSLTAAEKAQVIYYQIMRQTYSKHGYYAEQLSNKVIQPAMAMQIFQNQVKNLARAIGSIFIPIITTLMPYLIALTQLLTNLANRIASFFGFKLDNWDSGIDNINAGIGGIGDNAEKTGKKIKGMIGDFDELHTINFGDKSGAGVGSGSSFTLDASEFEYGAEWLGVTNEKLERAKEIIGIIKDYLVAIGLTIAGYKISKKILDLFGDIFGLSKKIKASFVDIAVGFALIVGGSYLVVDAIFDISQNGLNLKNTLELLIGSLGVFIGTYKILQGLKSIGLYQKLFGTTSIVKTALLISSVLLGLIVFVSAFTVVLDKGSEATGMLALAFSGLGVAMVGITIAGAPIVAVVVGIAAGIYMLIGYIVELQSRLENLKDPSVEIIDAWDWMADGIKNLGDTVKQATDTMGLGFSDAATQASNSFNAIDQQTLNTVNNLDQYLNQDLSGTLTGSEISFANYEQVLNDIMTRTDLTTSEKVKAMQEAISTQTKTATNNGITNFDTFDRKVASATGGIEKNVSSAMTNMSKDVDTGITEANKSLQKFGDVHIKTPSFSWKEAVNTGLSTMFKTTLAALNLPIALPMMAIDWFAEGGFPTKGDLFVANEAGAEWVGSMNGRTAVANQDQISTGVRQAAYEGMRQALAESDFGGVEVYNYMDSKQIASKMTKVKKSNANMYG